MKKWKGGKVERWKGGKVESEKHHTAERGADNRRANSAGQGYFSRVAMPE